MAYLTGLVFPVIISYTQLNMAAGKYIGVGSCK